MTKEKRMNTTLQITQNTVQRRLKEWVRQSYKNYVKINELFDEKKAVDLTSMPQHGQETPCLVIASGPSLDQIGPRLKEFPEDWTVFTAQNQAQTYKYYTGRNPKYIVCVDAGEVCLTELANKTKMDISGDGVVSRDFINWDKDYTKEYWKGSSLITHPSIFPKVFDYWQNDFIMFREEHPDIPLLSMDLPLAYPQITSGVRMGGDVSIGMMQIADYLGYGPIFLIGYDLGYPGGLERGQRYEGRADGFYAVPQIPINLKTALRVGENGCRTSSVLLMFKQSFMGLLGEDFWDVYIVSPYSGLMYELPQMDVDEILPKPSTAGSLVYEGWRNRPSWTDERKRQVSHDYLRSIGVDPGPGKFEVKPIEKKEEKNGQKEDAKKAGAQNQGG